MHGIDTDTFELDQMELREPSKFTPYLEKDTMKQLYVYHHVSGNYFYSVTF